MGGGEEKKKKRLFNLVQLSQFSQDKDPRDIYLIYKGARQGGRHVLKETFINSLSVDEGRRKKEQTSEETLRGDFLDLGRKKEACSLCVFSLVINNLWRTAETGGGWRGWGSGRNPVVDRLPLYLQQFIFQGCVLSIS